MCGEIEKYSCLLFSSEKLCYISRERDRSGWKTHSALLADIRKSVQHKTRYTGMILKFWSVHDGAKVRLDVCRLRCGCNSFIISVPENGRSNVHGDLPDVLQREREKERACER
jgi:hypothetical protein